MTHTHATLPAFVLHRYDWSESSLILDLFTRDKGRLAVVAKGAKRPYSQLRSVLQLFQRVNVSFARPRVCADESDVPEVQTLRAAEWLGGAPMLAGAALFSGFYCNELLLKMLARHDPHPQLFDAYALTLSSLTQSDEVKVQSTLRAFELVLLNEVGVLPDLSRVTLTQQPVNEKDRLALMPEAGVTAARTDETALAGKTLIGLQAALALASLPALRQACLSALPELKAALRLLLHYHFGTPTLRTRQVMVDLQSMTL